MLYISTIPINLKKLHPDAVIPTYGSLGAAGFDFYSLEDVIINPNETVLIKTGISMAIPVGFELQIRPRSGMSLKTNLRIANAPGTIDSDYRGEVCIIAQNNSGSDKTPLVIDKGTRIAQGVLNKVPQAVFVLVDQLDDTSRADGGFGSSGK